MRKFRIIEIITHAGKKTYKVQVEGLSNDFWLDYSEHDNLRDARNQRDELIGSQVVSTRVIE